MRKKKVVKKTETRTTSIRLTDAQKTRIYKRFETIQQFINESYKLHFSRKRAS